MEVISSLKLLLLIGTVKCLETEYATNQQLEKVPEFESLFHEFKCIEEPENFFETYMNIHLAGPVWEQTDVQQKRIFREEINQLVHYHHIEHSYKIENEEGPSHQKLFNISLILGKEIYFGTGKSKKDAKEEAAKRAIENTAYRKPPEKIKDNNYDEESPPTVVLNNLGLKHGYVIDYYMIDPQVRRRLINLNKIKDNTVLTNSSFWKVTAHLDEPPKSPFHVEVRVEEKSFFAKGHTIQASKHNAALKAIEHLKETGMDVNSPCTIKGQEAECKKSKIKLKSPVSLIHEFATSERLNVAFNLLGQSGPPHKPVFEYECTLGSMTTKGTGKSKKDAKRNVADKMLENLPMLRSLQLDSKANEARSANKIEKKKAKSIYDIAGGLLDSIYTVFSPGENDFNQNDVKTESKDQSRQGKKSSKKKKGHGQWSPREKLLEIGKELNMKVQINSLKKEGYGYHSIINMDLNPRYICYGTGANVQISQEYAAMNALKFLYKLDLTENIQESDLNIHKFEFDNFIWLTKDDSLNQ